MNHKDHLKRKAFEEDLLQSSFQTLGEEEDTELYTLPVVFHIIHQGGIENISDEAIRSSLQLLNDAFANLSPFDPSRGVPVGIDFCMASGTSITRHVSPLTNVVMEADDIALKEIGIWDPRAYINIWVVNSIESVSMGSSVAGYAMMPYTHGAPFDGIVVEAAFVNNDPDAAKVLVHEMGHYLGLYHTFEGGCQNDNCLTEGDRVCDTPPDRSTTPVVCHSSANTCTSDEADISSNNPFRAIALGGLGDKPDMHQNYMDYGFQPCQNTFTDGQRIRMRKALREARSSLLDNPNACVTCTEPVVASIDLPDTWPAGVPLTFTVNSTQMGLTVLWIIDNVPRLGKSVTLTIEQAKTVPVKVYISNGHSECLEEFNHTITFGCSVPTPSFTTNPDGLVSPGETVHFQTTGSSYTYSWQVDGKPVGTGTSIDYTVTGDYGRLITLVADNGTCKVESEPYYLEPGNCKNSKENNVWYFGINGGIDFNYTPPKAIKGNIQTYEGCAILCDIDGTPLFHSNGENVKNSQTASILLNGSGLSGSFTTTQSALFVPQPGNDRYVYLFTVAPQGGDVTSFNGIYYSVIDKQGDGGKGEIIIKNHLMVGPVAEKVTAVKNFKGNGIWIIAHLWDSNAFYVWLLTSSGVGSPVISNVGTVHDSPTNYSGSYALGELKASPSGKKLAMAIQGKSLYEVFDFDNHTGKISNPVLLQNSLTVKAYGVAFSPNERYLYGSSIAPYKVIRFDLQAGNKQAILNSGTLVGENAAKAGGAIQLAPDGKLYIAKRDDSYLSVIANPNAEEVSNCDYLEDGFRLAENTRSYYGLPNPVQSILYSVKPVIYGLEKICLQSTDTLVHYTFNPRGRAIYTWEHKGSNSFSIINDSTAAINFTTPGTDMLILRRAAPCNDMYDTLYIRSGYPQLTSIGPDVIICKDTSVHLDAGFGFLSYRWNRGARTQTIEVKEEGTVAVEVTTEAGCVARDSMHITYWRLPELDLGPDTSICTTESLILHAPLAMDSYLWNTGSIDQSINVVDSGSYSVSVEKYGCMFKDTIHIWKNIPEDILSLDSIVVCAGDPNLFYAPIGFDNYQWTLPSGIQLEDRSVALEDTGYYLLNYGNRCGSAIDSIYHYKIRIAPFQSIVTCDDTLEFTTFRNFTIFQPGNNTPHNGYSLNGNNIEIFESGEYIIIGQYNTSNDPSCMVAELISVLTDTSLVRPDKDIDLGPDTSYCEGNILVLNAGSGYDSYHWNTGSRDSSTTAYGFGSYSIRTHFCSYDYYDTIRIKKDPSSNIDLGSDKIQCGSEAFTLDAGKDFDWYRWNTGEDDQQVIVSGSGKYSVAAGINGCIARDTINIIDGTISLSISGDTIICTDETILLSAPYYSGIQYQWDSTGLPAQTYGNVLLIDSPGIYKVKNADCLSGSWPQPWIVEEEIIAAPDFVFSPDSICDGERVALSFDAALYSNFIWQDGSQDNPKYFTAPATPHLTLSGDKCQTTYSAALPVKNSADCNSGTRNPSSCTEISFYLSPNPGDAIVALDSECPVPENYKIKVSVVTTNGKFLAEAEGILPIVNKFLNDLMHQISAGMYVVQVHSEDGKQNLKWIISK